MREANLAVDTSAFEAMGIDELLSLGRDAGIRELEELSCHGTGAVVQMDVESRYDEAALSDLGYVHEWTHVSETEEGHLYVIAFEAPELPDSMAAEADGLVGTCDPELGDHHAQISLVGEQEHISGTVEEYKKVGVSPDLRTMGAYTGERRVLDELTDRQEEVVRRAFEMGYYEVPRTVSTDDVADDLGIDPSTVTEHLQRAERNVFDRLLE